MLAKLWAEWTQAAEQYRVAVPRSQTGLWASLRKVTVAVAGAVATLVAPALAWAQGCPLCYTAAAATRAGGIQALRYGILILMIPPVLIVGAVSVITIRRRNVFCEEPEGCGADQDEFEIELTDEGCGGEAVRWQSGNRRIGSRETEASRP